MTKQHPWWDTGRGTFGMATLLAAAVLLAGCGDGGDKVDPTALEAAFKDAPAEAPAPEPAEPQESTTDTVVPVRAAGELPVREVAAQAAAAMRRDEVSEAMVLLQSLRRARNLSPDQLTAVQDQMAALQGDLANKAAAGDMKAKQALDLMQQSTRW